MFYTAIEITSKGPRVIALSVDRATVLHAAAFVAAEFLTICPDDKEREEVRAILAEDNKIQEVDYEVWILEAELSQLLLKDKPIPDGTKCWFEYHCNESPDSTDAELWYRSHQRVEVIACNNPEEAEGVECDTFSKRCDIGAPLEYKIRFEDGHEGSAFEDELLGSVDEYCRPDPPARPAEKAPPATMAQFISLCAEHTIMPALAMEIEAVSAALRGDASEAELRAIIEANI